MIWVGSFKSLQSMRPEFRFKDARLEVHTWVQSEIGLISPLVDWLMSLIAGSRCVFGEEEFVELALREALSNAMLHGNRLDARKLVHLRCRCECTKGVFLVVRDQGHGFDPNNVPNPLAVENLNSEHGRGIHLMKLAMDEVSFERAGTEVHMWKDSAISSEHKTPQLASRHGCNESSMPRDPKTIVRWTYRRLCGRLAWPSRPEKLSSVPTGNRIFRDGRHEFGSPSRLHYMSGLGLKTEWLLKVILKSSIHHARTGVTLSSLRTIGATRVPRISTSEFLKSAISIKSREGSKAILGMCR